MTWDVEIVRGDVRVGQTRGDGARSVLFLPGRGDSLELREALGHRLALGARSVVMAELRGHGGSGRLGKHPDAVHIDDFEQHLNDIDRVLDTLDGDAVHLIAHSMGGLLGAHLLARRPERFASAAISSPMWRFTQPLPLVRGISATACAVGRTHRFAAGERPFDLDRCVEMRTGRDRSNGGGELEAFAGAHPELVRGGSTWGWVAAAARSMRELNAAPLERFAGPVLVGSCHQDRTVSLDAHRTVAARFARATVIELPGGHDPFVSAGAVEWWAAIDSLWSTG